MIGTFAADTLLAAAQILTAAGYTPPDRQYVSHNEPAGDLCEELVAWVDPVVDVAPQPSRIVRHEATMHVDLTRCVPAATNDTPVPPADELTTSAVDLADQAWAIWRGLVARWTAHDAPFGICEQVTFVDLVPLEPQGGFATWRATFRATITPGPLAGS